MSGRGRGSVGNGITNGNANGGGINRGIGSVREPRSLALQGTSQSARSRGTPGGSVDLSAVKKRFSWFW